MNDLLALMHDTMNKTARIKSCVSLLNSDIDNGRAYDGKLLKIIDDAASELNTVLDTYYKNQKENEK